MHEPGLDRGPARFDWLVHVILHMLLLLFHKPAPQTVLNDQ